MRDWTVGTVRICRGATDEPAWAARVRRLLAHFRADHVAWDVPFTSGESSPPPANEPGPRRRHETAPPDVVFSVLRMDEHGAARIVAPAGAPGALAEQPFAWTARRDAAGMLRREGLVCQSAVQFESICGCLHRCIYCPLTRLLLIPVNPEAIIGQLDGLLARCPAQTLFKHGASTDLLCFEPEYGLARPLVEYFARQPGRYLMLFTKSDNVDSLLALAHGGQTIICWSLSTRSAAASAEPFSAPTSDRIRAARRCQDAGYRVRFRFSPIIPLAGWRDEHEAMLDELRDAGVQPDLFTLRTIGWMDYGQLAQALDVATLDPAFRAIMAAAAADGGSRSDDRSRPLPEAARLRLYQPIAAAIRQRFPRTRISLCWESPTLWAALQAQTGMTPAHFVCNCGPTCTPPHPLLAPLADEATGAARVAVASRH